MFSDNLITAIMSGVLDGITVPRLAVVLLLAVVLFLLRDEKSYSVRFFLGFITGHFFTAGMLRIVDSSGYLIIARPLWVAPCFYGIVGLVLVLLGLYFAYLWYRLYWPLERGDGASLLKVSFHRQGWLFNGLALFIALVLGSCFSFIALSWPVNVSMLALSSNLFFPGLLWPTVWGLVIYEFTISLVLTVVFFAVRYCFTDPLRQLIGKHHSLILSVSAGIYLSFGVGLGSLYFQQLF